MIVEERIYTVHPGAAARYVDAWLASGRAAQVRHLGAPLGVFTCDIGELNTITYLWRFDSAADRAARRAALADDAEFGAFRASVRELLVAQRNRLLVPVPGSVTAVDEGPVM